MEHPTINDLPNELLELIFDQLDMDDLKDASLVCRRWSKLAFSGRRMDVVKLVPNFPWDKHLLLSNRKYRHLELGEIEKCFAHVKELLEAFNVSSLRIKDRNLSHSTLRLILLEVPNLQHLSIWYEPQQMNEMSEPFPVMRKLERLEISNGNLNSRRTLPWHTIAPSLQGLKMDCESEAQLEQWRLFSGQLKQVYATCYNSLNRFCEMTFPLLEELSIISVFHFVEYAELVERTNLFRRHEFFRRNTSLRLLRLDGFYLSKTLFQDITDQNKNLTSLEIRGNHRLRGYNGEKGVLKSLAKLTELKHLRLENLNIHIFRGCEALTSLQSLFIYTATFGRKRSLGFLVDLFKIAPQLRYLDIGSVAMTENVQYIWNRFTKLNRLKLAYSDEVPREGLSRIDRLPYLRNLELYLSDIHKFFNRTIPRNNVRHLTLHLCYIYDEDDLFHLPEIFPQLVKLNLNSSCYCLRKTTVDRLRELIPSCGIRTYGWLVSNEERKFGRKWRRDRITPAWEKEWKFNTTT